MKIQKGNIILEYDENSYIKSLKKNSFLKESIRSMITIILSLLIVTLEIYLFNKLPESFETLMYVTIFLTICSIIAIYTRVCIFLNRKNPNFYIIHNLMKMDKCTALKFYDSTIILYQINRELHSMSLNYILTNMMSKKTIIDNFADEKIESIYINTIEDKITIN